MLRWGTEILQVDLQTGQETPVVTGLSGSHGLDFVAASTDDPVVQQTNIFAVGSDVGGTQPDSVTMGAGSIWIEYGNGADSTGKLNDGSGSTIVRYSPDGQVEQTYSLPGSVDGLKYDPASGLVFALKNQDANSYLYTIDPTTNAVSGPLNYDNNYVYGANLSRGYDDVAFDNGKVFLSYTNPANTGNSVVQQLNNGDAPSGTLQTTSILRLGDTGTNLVTGQANQPLPVADPDSLKTLSDGSLILTSDHDQSLTIIANPGTAQQSASFVTLPLGSSGLDDAIIPTATSGTFYISNAGANNVVVADVTGLKTNDIYVSVGSDNAIDQLDPTTGALVPVITGLNSPHGMMFIPASDPGSVPVASDTIDLGQQASALLGNGSAMEGNGQLASLSSGTGSANTATSTDQSAGGSILPLLQSSTAPMTAITLTQQG